MWDTPRIDVFFLHIFIGKSHEISGWSLGFAASQVEDAQLPEEVHQAFDSMGISGWIYGIYGRCSVVADGSEIWFLYSCYMVSVGFYMFFFNGFVRFIYNYIWFYMVLKGFILVYGFCMVLWVYMFLYDIWLYMVVYGCIWLYMVLYGFIWFYMVFIWFYMVLYGFIWFYMVSCC